MHLIYHTFILILLLYYIKSDLINNVTIESIMNECCCDILKNDLFWDIYKNNFGNSKEVIIVKLVNESASNYYDQFFNIVVSHIMFWNYHPILFEILNDADAELTTTRYVDTFYWNGEKIPNIDNITIDYDDVPVENVVKNILIIAEDEELLNMYTEGVRRYPFFSPLSKFIVMITNNASDYPDETVKHMLRKLWNHYAIKNILIHTCFDGESNFYWYDPFVPVNDAYGYIHESVNEDFYLKYKQLTDYNGYHLRLSAFHRYPTALLTEINVTLPNNEIGVMYDMQGLDSVVFLNLAKDLNLTTSIVMSSKDRYGFKDEETHIFMGSSGDILYHQADINMNSRFIKFYDSYELDFVHPILTDQVCVVVPKSLEIPQWRALFGCFKPNVWIIFALINISCGFVWYGIKLFCKYFIMPNRLLRGFEQIQYNMFLIMTSGPVSYLGSNAAEQVFIAGCLAFNVVISGTFQVRK